MSLPNEKKWQLYCSQRLQGSTNNTSHNDRNDPKNNDGTVQSVWTTGGLSNDPQAYVDKVRLSVGMLENTCPSPSSSPTPHHLSTDSLDFQFTSNGQDSDPARLDPEVRNLFDSLQIALRTQPNSFVMRFIDDADGLSALLDFFGCYGLRHIAKSYTYRSLELSQGFNEQFDWKSTRVSTLNWNKCNCSKLSN